MKISFNISKSANQFFFIQNLAEWHFSCRASFNKEWLEQTGSLSDKEGKALNVLKKLLVKYDFSKIKNDSSINIYEYFTRYDELKDKRILGETEIKTYLSAMDVFEGRFEKIWKADLVKLEIVKEILKKAFEKEKKAVLKDLKIIFKDKINDNQDFEVYLLLSAGPSGGGGGANIGPGRVTLECSSLEERLVNHKIAVLWHEITHKLIKTYIEDYGKEFIKQNKIKALDKVIKNCSFNYSSELLVHSFFTNMSAFTEKYFPTTISTKLFESVKNEDSEWLTSAYGLFPMLLIYYNGQSIFNKLNKKSNIPPKEMAKLFCMNLKKAEKYFSDHNKKIEWVR